MARVRMSPLTAIMSVSKSNGSSIRSSRTFSSTAWRRALSSVARDWDAVRLLDGDADDEVQGVHRAAGSFSPVVGVEGVGVLVGEQVREDVDRAAVEQDVGVVGLERDERAFELRDEVLDGRLLSRLVAVLLEQVVGLVDDRVCGQRDLRDVLEQGGFADAMAS